MKKYLIYLQQQEKLSITVGILLGLVFLCLTNVKETNTYFQVFAAEQQVEGIESLVAETVELTGESVKEIERDVITSTTVTSNLVSDDTMEKSLETRTNVIVGGITVEEKSFESTNGIESRSVTSKQNSNEEVENKVNIETGQIGTDTKNVKNVPNDVQGCKSYNITYMAYTTVTSKTSNQYQLLYSDACYTDKKTGIRMVDGRYCIAMGSYYTHKVGQKVDLVFEDGRVVHCIIGDCKSDAHTDTTHRFHSVDGSVAEFVVDYEYFNSTEQWSDLCGGKIDKVIIIE